MSRLLNICLNNIDLGLLIVWLSPTYSCPYIVEIFLTLDRWLNPTKTLSTPPSMLSTLSIMKVCFLIKWHPLIRSSPLRNEIFSLLLTRMQGRIKREWGSGIYDQRLQVTTGRAVGWREKMAGAQDTMSWAYVSFFFFLFTWLTKKWNY